jgi:hypothetical protein
MGMFVSNPASLAKRLTHLVAIRREKEVAVLEFVLHVERRREELADAGKGAVLQSAPRKVGEGFRKTPSCWSVISR